MDVLHFQLVTEEQEGLNAAALLLQCFCVDVPTTVCVNGKC